MFLIKQAHIITALSPSENYQVGVSYPSYRGVTPNMRMKCHRLAQLPPSTPAPAEGAGAPLRATPCFNPCP